MSSYNESQLMEALASLAITNDHDPHSINDDCHHIYGFNKSSKPGPFFKSNHELSMLQKITAHRVLDYLEQRSLPETPNQETLLKKASVFHQQHGDIINLLTQIQSESPSMALAAEFKRASPSKGDIAPHHIHAGEQATLYAEAGAAIISVLTEGHWFKGSLDDLTEARLKTAAWAQKAGRARPVILRKDFCISTFMIAEATAAGADTVLLIVAITPKKLLRELIEFARSLGMEPLVEVHAAVELDVALEVGARVIGVNNRNLHTFQMDLATTDKTAEELIKRGCAFAHEDSVDKEEGGEGDDRPRYALCALSGMSSAHDVERYRQKGVGMCLIGESLMRAADPKAAIRSLCLNPADYEQFIAHSNSTSAYTAGTKIVKVCGITNPQDALVACQNGANLIGVIFAPKSKRCVTVEKARAVVDAVRAFGERSASVTFPGSVMESERISPLQSLIRKARSFEELARRPMVVGVFQNQSHEFIQEMVDKCGLDLVQLHGSEGMEAANVAKCGVPAIRVVDIETHPDGTGAAAPDAVEKLLSDITTDPVAILLDTSIKGNAEGGGTGVTFDWSVAEKLQNNGLPVIIAGGLTPSNVKEAVMNVRPWGIDVSSGVEASPGIKDHDAVEKFVKGARDAAFEANKGF